MRVHAETMKQWRQTVKDLRQQDREAWEQLMAYACDGTTSSASPGYCRPYINFWTYSSGTNWSIVRQAVVVACQTPKRTPGLRAM